MLLVRTCIRNHSKEYIGPHIHSRTRVSCTSLLLSSILIFLYMFLLKTMYLPTINKLYNKAMRFQFFLEFKILYLLKQRNTCTIASVLICFSALVSNIRFLLWIFMATTEKSLFLSTARTTFPNVPCPMSFKI